MNDNTESASSAPQPTRRSRLGHLRPTRLAAGVAGTAALAISGLAAGGALAAPNYGYHTHHQPIAVTVFSPGAGDHSGAAGVGFIVDVALDATKLKYNHLLTNAVAIKNVIDLTRAVRSLLADGYPVKHEDLATLSPYQTRHIKRFGDYVFTVTSPEPFDSELFTLVPDGVSSPQIATA